MFIGIEEAAALSGRHANTVKRWGKARKFKWSKPGGTRNAPWTIDRESFIAFMRGECDQERQERGLAKDDRPDVPDPELIIVARVPRYLPEGVDFGATMAAARSAFIRPQASRAATAWTLFRQLANSCGAACLQIDDLSAPSRNCAHASIIGRRCSSMSGPRIGALDLAFIDVTERFFGEVARVTMRFRPLTETCSQAVDVVSSLTSFSIALTPRVAFARAPG